MALKRDDKSERKGLKGFANKHFGKDNLGRSYGRQVLEGIGNSFTLNTFDQMRGRSVKDKTIVASMGGFLTSVMLGLGSMMTGMVVSENYDGSLAQNDNFYLDELTSLNDDAGYIAVSSYDHGVYLLSYEQGEGYNLYEGEFEGGGDITFSRMDEMDAALVSMRLANAFEENQFSFNGRTVYGSRLMRFEQLSAPFMTEATDPIMVAGDESVSMPGNGRLGWAFSDLQILFENARDSFESDGRADIDVPISWHENTIEAPMERAPGETLLTYFLTFSGLLGGAGLVTSAVASNARSRRRYNDEHKFKP